MVRHGRRMLLVVAVVAGVVGAAPVAAQADEVPPCRVGGGPHEYQARLTPLMDEADSASHEALGGQFAMLWLRARHQGWSVGLAPGPLATDQAHRAIVDALRPRVSPEDLDHLDRTLRVFAQPYSEAELRRVQEELAGELRDAQLGVAWSAGVGCTVSDAWRVEVMLFNDSTPDTVARVREIVDRHGDRARLQVSPGPPPGPAVLLPRSPSVFQLLAFATPRRCVKGSTLRLRVRRQARDMVESVILTVGKRRTQVPRSRLSKPVTIRLAGRRTTAHVTVALRTGARAVKALTYRRCG